MIDFPFDLNNLFSMQYSFDQLKMAIEYLANQQGNQQVLINELLGKEPSSVTIIKGNDNGLSGRQQPERQQPVTANLKVKTAEKARMTQSNAIPSANADTSNGDI